MAGERETPITRAHGPVPDAYSKSNSIRAGILSLTRAGFVTACPDACEFGERREPSRQHGRADLSRYAIVSIPNLKKLLEPRFKNRKSVVHCTAAIVEFAHCSGKCGVRLKKAEISSKRRKFR